MILPIVAYGDPILKQVGENISLNYPELSELIDSMYDTMYASKGVGLAAPQIGLSIRLFVIDCKPFKDDNPSLEMLKKTFINAELISEEGEAWFFREGCLSIPEIREEVLRKPRILLRYFDENFVEHLEHFEGISARVIQHEYDHIEGVLFTDYLSPLRKRMIQKRLTDIKNGKINTKYRMRFFKPKKHKK